MHASEMPPLGPGMDAVRMNQPLVASTMLELERLKVTKCFVMANRSTAQLEPVIQLIAELQANGALAAPIFTSIVMGGAEEGVMEACNRAAAVNAECVITLGGGAIHDAGKIVRMWLSVDGAPHSTATLEAIRTASGRSPMPTLPPQIAAPNSFAMAELTHVSGVRRPDGTKSGAAHPMMMPTVVVFDPALTHGLPDWVRFGTALRGVEHAVGAVCSPLATEEVRQQALNGLAVTARGLRKMIANPEDAEALTDCYMGGWLSIRAINTGCYPALGHFLQNHYSAKFDVHQGSCSGILCARIMAYHATVSAPLQAKLAATLGRPEVSAPRAVTDLVAHLPGVANDHSDANVEATQLAEFAGEVFASFGETLNKLSPRPFASAEDLLAMMTRPLAAL
jgi:maleylacetate reductase